MSYVNADEILPEDLVREIQRYVDGKVLYIPRKDENLLSWGEKNGTRDRLAKRNKEIVWASKANGFDSMPYFLYQIYSDIGK